MPLVSVITTVKDCERFIGESISSILSQSFTDFELLVLNDGSIDRTVEIVRRFKDDRLIFLDSNVNYKIPKRRNQAIRLATGKYIAIQDADDFSLTDRLYLQSQFLEDCPGIFCVGSHAIKIDWLSNTIGKMDYPPACHKEIVEKLKKPGLNPMIDPTVMYRREDMMQMGGYTLDKNIYTVPDLDLWCRAALSGRKLANIQTPLIEYRVNPNGMTNKHNAEMMRAHGLVWQKFKRGMGF